MEIFATVLSGTCTYVAGQITVKLFIDPVQELKKTIGQISHSLIEHANIIGNTAEITEKEKTSQHLRELSSRLQAQFYLVPKYYITAKIFGLPQKEKITKASSLMINLSNKLNRTSDEGYLENKEAVEEICDLLGIFMSDEERPSKRKKDLA